MSDSDGNISKWVETWQRATPALKKVKKEEMRKFDYQKNLPLIDDMLQWACDHQQVRLNSGLVEQQRLFMKLQTSDKVNR